MIEIEGTILNRKEESEAREMPDVRGLSVEAGKLLLASQGFTVIAPEKGVIERVEKRGADSVRFIVMKNVEVTAKKDAAPQLVPDFVGMTVGRAMKVGTMNNIQVRVIGEGKVLKQFPEQGATLDKNNPIITLFGEE